MVLTYPDERETLVRSPSGTSLANFFAQPGPENGVLPSTKLTAWLDQSDRVVTLPSDWEAFAEMTGIARTDRDQILGRPVGWFIADETVRECFRMILEHTRRERRAMRIVSRCDWLDVARALQLRFAPMSAGAIECTWSIIHGPAAEEIRPVRSHLFSDGEHIRMCSWCRKVYLGAIWQALETVAPRLGLLDHGPLPAITHGICTQCSRLVWQESAEVLQDQALV